MKARGKTYAVLGVVVLLAGAVWFWREAGGRRRAAEAALAHLLEQRLRLAAELRAAESRAETAKQARVNAETAPTASGAVASAGAPAAPAAPPLRTMSELIANQPKLEAVELERQRAAALQEYGPYLRRLGPSPEQTRKFQDNPVALAERTMDLRAAARTQDELGKQLTAKLLEQAKTDYEAAQSELLGAEGFRGLQDYERTIPARNIVVRSLAGVAALEGVPLTPEQGERLLAATLNASRGVTPNGHVDIKALDWAALDAEARQILTPAQLELFKNVQPPSGFIGRWNYQFDAALAKARASDAAKPAEASPTKPGG